MDKLKPCPFCGGKANTVYAPYVGIVYVQCNSCAAMLGRTAKIVSALHGKVYFEKEKDAVDAWNKRCE